MTGYGKAEGVVGNRKYNVEVRSLNSKQFDLNTRIPSMFREKEMVLRKLLRSRVIRGKCDFFLFYELDPNLWRQIIYYIFSNLQHHILYLRLLNLNKIIGLVQFFL